MMNRCSISGIDPSTPYVVVDTHTGEVVFRTTYRHRNRARRWADRKDLQYGACRYSARFLPGQDLGPVRLNAYGDIGGA
jgi:hypothetical protein